MPLSLRIAPVLLCWACGGETSSPSNTSCGPASETASRVIDGDTIELADGTKIRYLGADTPETQGVATPDCYGPEAKAFNEMLVTGQEVRLEYDQECEDRFDRTLAYVYLGDRMVSFVLLERGYARKLIIPPNDRYEAEMTELEHRARVAGIGLWGACE
jgi:micrococcal nuclease